MNIRDLAEEKPLAHPLAFDIRYAGHSSPSPEHLREMYGTAFRAMSPRYDGVSHRIARLYPREHGKSEAGANILPAWSCVRDPNVRVLLMSETATQAKDILGQTKSTVKRVGEDYGIEIAEDSKKSFTLERDANHREPTIRAAGFDTGVTGGHYDLLVFDDVVSWKTQRTETRRRNARRQFFDYTSNLGSEGDSVFLVLGTRKHPEDLYGTLINSVGWNTRVEEAIQDWSIVENREFDLITEDGKVYDGADLHEINPRKETVGRVRPHRDVDVLWPDRWPLEALLKNYVDSISKDDEGPLIWKRENQNDPEALQGQVLGEDMLHFTPVEEMEDAGVFDRGSWIAGVDLGIEEDPEKAAASDTDYWAVAVGLHDYTDDITYFWDVWRKRGMSLQKGIRWVNAKLNQPRVGPFSQVLAESNQAQRWFVQTARDEGLDINRSSSSGKKEDRIIGISPRFESGRVRIVERAASTGRFEGFASEWASFPTGSHDDRLDAAEIMLRAIGTERVERSSYTMSDLPTG